MSRRLSLFLAAFAAGTFSLLAADEALPKAETILDRFIQVTGGKAAYEKRKTEISIGTIEFPAQGLKGTLTRYAADPDRTYSAVDIPELGRVEEGTSGGVAWDKNVILGPRIKTGEEKAQAIREATFNADLRWRQMFTKVETVGVEKVNGEDCYKLLLTPPTGNPETAYFQKKSGFAVKMTITAASQLGDIPVENLMSDYKEFGGVLVPTKMTQSAGGQDVTITLQTVKVNQEISPDHFELPAEIKALLNRPPAPNKKK